jgi:pre-mRNA-splicing factor 18
MEKLKAELARKKAEAEALKQKAAAFNATSSSSGTSQVSSSTTKFIRQKDVLETKQRELEEKQRKEEEERLSRKRQLDDQLTRAHEKALGVGPEPPVAKSEPPEKKMKKSETTATTTTTTSSSGHEGGSKSNEIHDDNERKVEELTQTADSVTSESTPCSSSSAQLPSSTTASNTTHAGPYTALYDPNIRFTTMPGLSDAAIVQRFFQALLNQWEHDLNQRPDHEKHSAKGKNDLRSFEHCHEHILPLFRLCQQNTVPVDILHRVHLMVKFCEEGNFVKANDEYIKTAIGNAAWPIGLTMVGIHERTGRERISTAKVAHVMNNEMERKYLTSVKRLISFCQTKRPDVPPSMKVLT